MGGQPQLLHQFQVKFPGCGAHQPRGSGVGVLLGFRPGELPHQVLRHHEEVRDPLQAAPRQVVAELVNGVEGLELAAGVGVQLGKRDFFMDSGDDALRPPVPVGVAGPDLLVPAQQHIIAPPGVDGKALHRAKLGQSQVDARLHVAQQGVHVPGEAAVPLRHPIGEAVDLFGFDLAVLKPTHDMPA